MKRATVISIAAALVAVPVVTGAAAEEAGEQRDGLLVQAEPYVDQMYTELGLTAEEVGSLDWEVQEHTFVHPAGEPVTVHVDHAIGEVTQGEKALGTGSASCYLQGAGLQVGYMPEGVDRCPEDTIAILSSSVETSMLTCDARDGCVLLAVGTDTEDFGFFQALCRGPGTGGDPAGVSLHNWGADEHLETTSCRTGVTGISPATWTMWTALCLHVDNQDEMEATTLCANNTS